MSFTNKRSATLKFLLLGLLLTAVSGQASAATTPKIVITSPTTAPSLAGSTPVTAKLKTTRSAGIREARFYVNGVLVTTDRKYPFAVDRGVRVDTRSLRASSPYVNLLVKYQAIKKRGKVAKKSVLSRVRVSLIDSGNPAVTSKSVGPPPVEILDPDKLGYPMVLDEEFDGDSLHTDLWNTQRYDSIDEEVPGTPALSRPFNIAEGAAYSPSNVSVSDGALDLKISDTPAPDPSAEGMPRSTGMVNTKNKFKFKYGYVETRAWVPECGGCWPSFWIMPATDDHWPPEIDIFEYFQFASYTRSFPHSVFHYKPDGDLGPYPFEHHTSETDDVPSPKPQEWMVTHPAGDDGNYYNGWHTYRMHWTPDYVDLQVDRNPALRFSGASKIPQEPMYLIYMMAICDIDGTVCTADKSVPAAGNSMKIDYLRVYSDNT